ncbi:MAG TPA: hypothetical protein VHP83_11325, partial [Aggregatilineaceae bacterium]|nr:hypothetical protein [Aggregatilineaceae bacterium]
ILAKQLPNYVVYSDKVDNPGEIMQVSEFKRILEIGLGRAILFLQTHDATPYREAILEACLHDTRYDGQAESRRATYLFDVIAQTGFQEFYREPILQALEIASDPNTYDSLQLNDLATNFADQGDQAARRLVYDQFVAHLTSDDWGDVTRAHNLISLDGTDGFLFAVEQFGKRLPACSEQEPPYWFPSLEKNWDDDERTYWDAAIQRAADNPHLAAYVAFEQERRANQKTKTSRRKPLSFMSYDQLKPKITHRTTEYGLATWGERANEADLECAANDLLALAEQTDILLLRKYVCIFRERRFPLDPQKLIDLASQARHEPPSYDEDDRFTPQSRLILTALNALGNVSHPEVRQLAFELVEGRQWIAHAAILLKSNWQNSDWSVLEALTQETFEPYDYHGLGMDIRELFEAHPEPKAAQTLINLYEYGPCSECREHYVKALDSIQAVPEWMRAECRYDADHDLREWAAGVLRD